MHPIVTTVIQRLFLGIATLFVVSIIIFSSIEMLPGDFGQAVLGQAATEETVAAFRKELGLDKPAYIRYFDWVAGVIQGDLGTSFSGRAASGVDRSRPVAELIAPRLWNTLFLAGMTAIIAVPLALFLGITAALYRDTYYDKIVSASTLTTISFPEFFVAYILILLLTALWPVFPSLANIDVNTQLGERIYRSALPALTLTLVIVAHMMRMTRAARPSAWRRRAWSASRRRRPTAARARAARAAGARRRRRPRRCTTFTTSSSTRRSARG